MSQAKLLLFVFPLFLSGCAQEPHLLGDSVSQLRTAQTYNQNATEENLGYIPTGSGERIQATIGIYQLKTSANPKGTIDTSEVIEATTD